LTEIYWKWANFAILAGGLGYLISKKAPAFFLSRSEAIRKGIEEADRLRREAEQRVAGIEQRLRSLEAEVGALRTRAREEMAAENERLQRETQEHLKKIREQAEQEIAGASKAAQREVRAHAAELAIGLAATKIRDMLSPQADRSLVLSFLEGLEEPADGKPDKEIN
jgi:F-type H+-transporting ATPase subunit b